MYSNNNNQSPGQWNPNVPPSSQPQQWSPQPPNGQYAPRPNQVSSSCTCTCLGFTLHAKEFRPYLVAHPLFCNSHLNSYSAHPPSHQQNHKMAAIDPSLSSDSPADPNGTNQIPPISQAIPPAPAMQTLQPQHPDQYRALPAPPQMYAAPYQQPPPMPYPPQQPAPRQRTAIACRYCRRRKVCNVLMTRLLLC